jgi:hypothetical protein
MKVLQKDTSEMLAKLFQNTNINEVCHHNYKECYLEKHKLEESLQGNYNENFDDEEKKESFLKGLFGSGIKLAGLPFRRKVQKLVES